MKYWKQNLAIAWLSQFLSLMGIAFAMPFVPFYLQDMGITDMTELKIWISLFAVSAPVTLMIFSPIWGYISDRYGRRPMMLRASLGGAIVLTLMGTASSPQELIIYRMLQGSLSGILVAAQTMISVSTPNHRQGMALGILSSSVFGGMMAGQVFGGVFAEIFGYRNTFFCAAGLMIIASLLILFGIKEFFNYHTENAKPGNSDGKKQAPKRVRTNMIFFLILLILISITVGFDIPWVPMLVQEIHGSLSGSAIRTGILGAISCIAGMISGFMIGRLADRIRVSVILMFVAMGSGIFMALHGLIHSFNLLVGARFIMFFFAGGIEPLTQIWLARITPERRRGFIFGWATTARATGFSIAPLISGLMASAFGIRSVFFTASLVFMCLIPCVYLINKRFELTESAQT